MSSRGRDGGGSSAGDAPSGAEPRRAHAQAAPSARDARAPAVASHSDGGGEAGSRSTAAAAAKGVPAAGRSGASSRSTGGAGGGASAGSGGGTPAPAPHHRMAASDDAESKGDNLLVKVGMVGDAQVGKTSLMVRYVEGKFDEDYIETLGVNFMEKTIKLPRADVTFSVWDLGGAREFVSMLPLACNDAVAVLFVFDLTRRSTLMSMKEWYRQVRGLNKTAFPFLVGTKFDTFVRTEAAEQEAVIKQARKYAKAMKAPLIFTSASVGINVQKIFKLVFSKVFNVRCSIPQKSGPGEPIIEY